MTIYGKSRMRNGANSGASPTLPLFLGVLVCAFNVGIGGPAKTMPFFNITDYGAVGDGATLCTQAIQKAVDACHAAGGRRLVTPLAPSYWHGWSPDGRTLTFCAQRNENYDIYTIPTEGGEENRLTTADGLDDGHAVSASAANRCSSPAKVFGYASVPPYTTSWAYWRHGDIPIDSFRPAAAKGFVQCHQVCRNRTITLDQGILGSIQGSLCRKHVKKLNLSLCVELSGQLNRFAVGCNGLDQFIAVLLFFTGGYQRIFHFLHRIEHRLPIYDEGLFFAGFLQLDIRRDASAGEDRPACRWAERPESVVPFRQRA